MKKEEKKKNESGSGYVKENIKNQTIFQIKYN
jgi:hypothetical protein